jgi:hypothetical protein
MYKGNNLLHAVGTPSYPAQNLIHSCHTQAWFLPKSSKIDAGICCSSSEYTTISSFKSKTMGASGEEYVPLWLCNPQPHHHE